MLCVVCYHSLLLFFNMVVHKLLFSNYKHLICLQVNNLVKQYFIMHLAVARRSRILRQILPSEYYQKKPLGVYLSPTFTLTLFPVYARFVLIYTHSSIFNQTIARVIKCADVLRKKCAKRSFIFI